MGKPVTKYRVLILGCFITLASVWTEGNVQAKHQYLTLKVEQVDPAGSQYAVQLYKNSLPILQKMIRIEGRKTRAKALSEIAEKANLGVIFNASLPGLEEIVSFKEGNQLSVAQALEKVLGNTQYKASLTDTREIILVKRNSHEALWETGSVFRQTITGKVTDMKTGDSLPGVNVVVKGTTIGTTTNDNGEYLLDVPDGATTLVFSFIGYNKKEVTVNGRTVINIALVPNIEQLNEVVVTGYGTMAREDLSGSISSVSEKELSSVTVQSFDQAIQGKAAGVQVVNSSGQPGSGVAIRIRGIGSIGAGTAPLYIIDGVPVNSGNLTDLQPAANALSSLNPNDVESINILKDASAASIYGAQAANGVVIITTKQGRNQVTQFSFNSKFGYREVLKKIPVLSGPEFISLARESMSNYNQNNPAGSFDYDIDQTLMDAYGYSDPAQAPNTDWADLYYRRGLSQKYQLSVRGGSNKTRFYVSGSWEGIEGQIIYTGFQRGTFRLNLDHTATDRLTITSNLNLSTNTTMNVALGGAFASPVRGGILIVPTESPYDENEELRRTVAGTNFINPLYENKYQEDIGNTRQLIGRLSADYNILPNLTFKSAYNIDYTYIREKWYVDPRTVFGSEFGGLANRTRTDIMNWSTEQTINYKIDINKHTVDGLAGVSYQDNTTELFAVWVEGFPSYKFKGLSSAASYNGSPDGFLSGYKMAGAFGRINYNFDDRYILTLTSRYDGSSRFGADQQWGFFPSFAVAWRMANESFMEDVDFVDNLKVRYSLGKTGNSRIGNFSSRGLFSAGANYLGEAGLSPSTVGNPELGWEEAVTFNYGVDYSLFKGRLSGSIEYFVKNSNRLLLERPLPLTTGFSQVLQNVGKIQNRGWEILVSTDNIRSANFQWSTDFNISFIKNEVKSLYGNEERIIDGLGANYIIGMPLRSYFRVEYAGVNPADGRPMWYDENGDITYFPTSADRKIIGSDIPDHYGGISNTFSYKNFELITFIQWEIGNLRYNTDKRYAETQMMFTDSNQWRTQLDRWQKPGDITKFPQAVLFAEYQHEANQYADFISSALIEDASYIRLKNIRLSYNVPANVLENIGLRGVTLYAQGQNLWTESNWTGYDPEMTNLSTFGVYPTAKVYNLGINIDF